MALKTYLGFGKMKGGLELQFTTQFGGRGTLYHLVPNSLQSSDTSSHGPDFFWGSFNVHDLRCFGQHTDGCCDQLHRKAKRSVTLPQPKIPQRCPAKLCLHQIAQLTPLLLCCNQDLLQSSAKNQQLEGPSDLLNYLQLT